MKRQYLFGVGGFLIGGLVGLGLAFLLGVETWQQFPDRYTITALENIQVANKIRAGQENDVVQNIDTQLPVWLRAIVGDDEIRRSSAGEAVLWHARDYYAIHSIPIPEDLKDEFARLAVRHPASCPMPDGGGSQK